MAETITINSMTKKDEAGYTDVIRRVTFNLAVTENEGSANDDFTLSLPSPKDYENSSEFNFIALENVTEQNVKDWVMNDPLYSGFVSELTVKIGQNQETEITTLPWT